MLIASSSILGDPSPPPPPLPHFPPVVSTSFFAVAAFGREYLTPSRGGEIFESASASDVVWMERRSRSNERHELHVCYELSLFHRRTHPAAHSAKLLFVCFLSFSLSSSSLIAFFWLLFSVLFLPTYLRANQIICRDLNGCLFLSISVRAAFLFSFSRSRTALFSLSLSST